MKLLYCDVCGDIFNLTGIRVKECHCGRVKGVYINYSEAIVNGNGISIAIGNGALSSAVHQKQLMEYDQTLTDEPDYDRKDYQVMCKVNYCWIRPNEGTGNPHQFIKPDTDEGWGNEEDSD